ncbi:MAG: hypothetical protein H6945_16555 [Zoogloeaceae bacterium]|nr:hypothetical protein [Zoogloeaceae bacterium]
MGLAWDEFIKIVVQIGETSLDQSLGHRGIDVRVAANLQAIDGEGHTGEFEVGRFGLFGHWIPAVIDGARGCWPGQCA